MSSCEPSDAQSIRAHSIRVILIGPIYIRSFLIWLLDLPAGNLNRSDQNKSELPFFYFKFPNVWNYSNAMTALCVLCQRCPPNAGRFVYGKALSFLLGSNVRISDYTFKINRPNEIARCDGWRVECKALGRHLQVGSATDSIIVVYQE